MNSEWECSFLWARSIICGEPSCLSSLMVFIVNNYVDNLSVIIEKKTWGLLNLG